MILPIAKDIKNDNKFSQFIKTVIEPNKDNKILIFSEFTETVEYLYKNTKDTVWLTIQLKEENKVLKST